MNCKEFSKYIVDYVHRTLDDDAAVRAESHLISCAQCASLVKELQSTSVLVRSLERKSAPVGFEERLKTRLASQKQPAIPSGVGSLARSWLRAIAEAFPVAPARGRRLVLRTALAGLLLCAIVVGWVLTLARNDFPGDQEMDWVYIETCQDQHESFAAANPLADDSAVILRERARDLNREL